MTAREVPGIELVERGGRLSVSTPSHVAVNNLAEARWKIWAVSHGGAWDRGSMAWVFHPDQRAAVEAALREIFGEDEE